MEHMDGAGRRKDRKQWKLNPYRIIIKKKDSRREGIIQANCNMCLSVKLEQHCWRRALSAGLPSECWAQQEASSLQPPPTVTTSRDRCHHPGCIYHREVPHSAGTQRAGSTWCRCDYCPNGPTWPTGHSTPFGFTSYIMALVLSQVKSTLHNKMQYLNICKKRNHVCATHSLSISGGIRLASSSGTLNGGNEGPYVKRSNLKKKCASLNPLYNNEK